MFKERTPVRVIHPNEYPHNPYDWSSLQPALHLVKDRSPVREPATPHASRFYQWVKGYACQPKLLKPQQGLVSVEFDVSTKKTGALVSTERHDGLVKCRYTEGSLRYRLRLCRVPKEAENVGEATLMCCATYWPDMIYIQVNNQPVNPRRKQYCRYDLPIELTTLVRTGKNCVQVSIPASRQQNAVYALTIELVTVSSADAMQRFITTDQERFSEEETTKQLRHRLQSVDDDDVVVKDNFLSISVADPFSATLFVTPVRSKYCKHVECFDLGNWLESRPSKAPKRPGEPSKVDDWKCPICQVDARPSTLRVDEFFSRVRASLVATGAERTKMIRVSDGAQWEAVEEADDSEDEAPTPVVKEPVRRASTDTPIVILDDDDD